MIDRGPMCRFPLDPPHGRRHNLYRKYGFAAPDNTYRERPASL